MNIILIDNGKQPNEPMNAKLMFLLPVETSYGNFQLKLLKIINRLDEANRRIIESVLFWEKAKEGILYTYEAHIFANEQAIYLIRRTCDEIISLIWCLNYWKNNNHSYPIKIKYDCIGKVVNQNKESVMTPFKENLEVLEEINKISNAYKHSFINSDLDVIGNEEPCVHALALDYNKLASEPKFCIIELERLIIQFNKFYKDSIEWLRSFSNENYQ